MEISTWKTCMPQMKAARRASDWRPEPPTPTSSMWPPGCFSSRQMRDTCSTANRNMARFMGRLDMPLWSVRYSSIVEISLGTSFTSA